MTPVVRLCGHNRGPGPRERPLHTINSTKTAITTDVQIFCDRLASTVRLVEKAITVQKRMKAARQVRRNRPVRSLAMFLTPSEDQEDFTIPNCAVGAGAIGAVRGCDCYAMAILTNMIDVNHRR